MKHNCKALIALTLAITLLAALPAGCAGASPAEKKENKTQSSGAAATADEPQTLAGLTALGIDPGTVDVFPQVMHDAQNEAGFQLEPPAQGDTVAVIHTTEGDITLRLFPDQAPKTVTNFITLAQSGKYNNTTFYRVDSGKRISGGYCGGEDSSASGSSSFGGAFEDEFCDSLFNIRGAVSMVNTAKDSNGSCFFINQTTAEAFAEGGGWNAYQTAWDAIADRLDSYKDSTLLSAYIEENGDAFLPPDDVPAEVKLLYVQNGGNPEYDGAFNAADRGNTVFAQVTEGMEVADKIASAKTDSDGVPEKPVVIKSIEIITL